MKTIKVNCRKVGNHKVNSVLASELYKKLEIQEDFSNWIEDKLKKINFIENIDYSILVENPNEKYLIKEYILTLESAKHISMMSESTKGFEVRNYFIEIEKKYQKKLLKNSKKYKNLLKNEKEKSTNLFEKLQKCKEELNICKKEKSFIKDDSILKLKDIELEVLKVINQFKSIELMSIHTNLSQSEAYEYIDALLNSLKSYFRTFIFNKNI